MTDTYYFPHDYNARMDIKVKKLIHKHGMAGYGIFWAIVEDLYSNNNQLTTDISALSYDYRAEPEVIQSIIQDFNLFKIEGEFFGSESVAKRLQKRTDKSEKAKASAAKKWGKETMNNFTYGSVRSQRLSEARKKGSHTKVDWEEMREFFGSCVRCGETNDIVKDHIIPIYQGGSDGIDNIQPLCRSCNASKGSENVDYRENFCLRNACEMPARYRMVSARMHTKEKESKVNGKYLSTSVDNTKKPTDVGKETDGVDDVVKLVDDYKRRQAESNQDGISMDEAKSILKSSRELEEAVCMKYHITKEKMDQAIDTFILDKKAEDYVVESEKDVKKHFRNWVPSWLSNFGHPDKPLGYGSAADSKKIQKLYPQDPNDPVPRKVYL